MENEDQRCLGLFLLELKRHMERLLKDNSATQDHQQRIITAFFSPITPTQAIIQSRATQMGFQLRHYKGVKIDRESSNLLCTKAPTLWTTTSPPMTSTNKGPYLPPSLLFSSLRRPLHSGSTTYARDLSKTKLQNLTCAENQIL